MDATFVKANLTSKKKKEEDTHLMNFIIKISFF